MGDVGEIAEHARQMDDFLDRSEQAERRAFIESFVKDIVVMQGQALLRYRVPMPEGSLIPGRITERVAVDGSSLRAIRVAG